MISRSVFLVSADAAVHEKLRTAFQRHGVDWDALPMLRKPAGEPTRETVSHGSEWLTQQRADRIIAIGGGSVLDWARLSAALANGWLELDSGRIAGRLSNRPELVLVPTTCGTGAEAAAVAVYMVGARKIGVFCPGFVADQVVLDGQFLSLLDDRSLCAFLSDALSHAVESFVSIVPNALAKEAALSTLSLILTYHGAPASTSRAQHLMEAGYLGGVAASNCSVGVVHAFAHSMARYGIAHGRANALGLPAGMEANECTPEMDTLLRRSGFPSVRALIDTIRPITTSALTNGAASAARAALANVAQRDEIATAMLSDVCLRTNPRRLERDDVDRFLESVARSAAS